jgi:hypothetical protein
MKLISQISFTFLIAILFFTWGFSSLKFDLPPSDFLNDKISEVENFIEGHDLEKETTVIEKLQNDLLEIPARDLFDSDFKSIKKLQALKDESDSLDSDDFTSLVYTDKEELNKSGVYGVAIGTRIKLKNDESIKQYILIINDTGKLIKYYDLSSNSKCDCNGKYKFHSKEKTGPFTTNLLQYNSCGGKDWSVPAKYTHHHFQMKSLANAGIWAWDGLDIVEYSLHDGNELQRISMSEIINNNTELHVFEARLAFGKKNYWQYGNADFKIKSGSRRYEEVEHADWDPFHPNDIEPLNDDKADSYKKFIKGDLLISLRSINMVFVYRPSTKKIIWHIYGLTSRQHDPDWNDRGTITIFDNKYHNGKSVISEINPNNNNIEHLVFSTPDFLFYKPTGGNHELSDDGNIVFFNTDSAIYGRREKSNNSEMAFAYRNRYKNGKFLTSILLDVLNQKELYDIANSECE